MMTKGCVFLALTFSLLTANSTGATGLPLRFERGDLLPRGSAESAPKTRFVARARGYSLLMEDKGLSISTGHNSWPLARFTRSSGRSQVEAVDPLPARVNYYIGDPSQWVTGAPCWSRVRYRSLYSGLDVEFYGNAGSLEYDVRVAAGADPSRFGLDLDASTKPKLDPAGDLILETPAGEVVWHKPVAFQDSGAIRRPVKAEFSLHGRHVSFRLGDWDSTLPLVIDPAIGFSTYLGGSNDDGAFAVAADSAGNIYIAGNTNSGNLPVTASSYQPDYRGPNDGGPGNAFIAKFNPSGSQLIYITYLGGTSDDLATAIAVDNSGNAVVAGATSSADFPVTKGAYQAKYAGGGGDNAMNPASAFFPGDGDAFIAKFDPNGKLLWSTYLGGSGSEGVTAIALDGSANIFVTGLTDSGNFPTTAGAYQRTYGGSGGQPTLQDTGYVAFVTGDAFVAKLDSTGAHILAATYLGGSMDDAALAIALDAQGGVWIGGATLSTNFPITSGALQTTFGGGSPSAAAPVHRLGDGFVAELNSDLSVLRYSTYLGGSLDDTVTALAIDPSGYLCIGGMTQSSNFPITAGAYSTAYHGPTGPVGSRPYLLGDGFAAKLNPATSKLLFSTYLGGSDDDIVRGIAADAQGNIVVAGMTNSANFPVTANAIQGKFAGPGTGQYAGVGDAFLAKLSGSGSQLLYSSFLGGSSSDASLALAHDISGNFYLAGFTNSTNLPATSGVVQAKSAGGADAFLVQVTGLLGGVQPSPAIAAVTNGASFAAGSVVPGSIATIFGTNLTGSTGIHLASSLPLPSSLEDVQVRVNGTAAPLFAVDNVNGQQQINFQVPWEVSGTGQTTLQVVNNGSVGSALQTPVLAAQPGIFSYSQGGQTFGAILHANYQLADISHPAVPGEVVLIFTTGLGNTSSHPATGAVAAGAAATTVAPTVTIGNTKAAVSYSGLAPGFVGLYQINVTVPSGLESGNQAVVVTLGVASNSVLLPVK